MHGQRAYEIALLGFAAILMTACGSVAGPSQSVDDATLPASLPTADLSETPAPPPSFEPTPSLDQPANLQCFVIPDLVGFGQRYQLTIVETGPWDGVDRYYDIGGVPEMADQIHAADGGTGNRLAPWSGVGPDNLGTHWTVHLRMRDWDIHGIRPNNGITPTIRPPGTQHDLTCDAPFSTIPA